MYLDFNEASLEVLGNNEMPRLVQASVFSRLYLDQMRQGHGRYLACSKRI
jgi:hypothetical protein